MGASLVAGGTLAAGAGGVEWLRIRRAGVGAGEDADLARGGEFAGVVAFEDEGHAPLDRLLGDELDGRRYMDLTHLDAGRLVTPTDLFYVRTRISHLLDAREKWSIRVGAAGAGGGGRITMPELKAQAAPQGLHLMECAGNTRAVSFGMIGVASWQGVPLAGLLDRVGLGKSARILVSGFDRYAEKPRTPSIAGCSWIFSRREIEDARAFLATAMNGQPLQPDHGAPVRLMVPGWYGCACIKWVNEIAAAGEDAEPTSQMQEYAGRTNQRGLPGRAREYQPAMIDPAAMPVRIEKWVAGGRAQYKVIGVVWGGTRPANRIEIRFGPQEPYVPVTRVEPAGENPWGLWMHVWRPRVPGVYRIRLRLADPSIRTRRLDTGYYVRQVEIGEV